MHVLLTRSDSSRRTRCRAVGLLLTGWAVLNCISVTGAAAQPEWVRIPAGTFVMGCTGSSRVCDKSERPAHRVTLTRPYDLAATLTTRRVYERFLGTREKPEVFYHGHSFTGNPLAAAAALASLEVFERENVLEKVRRDTELMAQGLKEQVAPLEAVGEIRGRGLMTGIELVADRQSKEPFAAEIRFAKKVILAARRRGVIIRPLGDVVVLMPHLSFSEEELSMLVRVTAESIEEIWNEVRG